jgi:hypothetical protein
MGETVGAKTLHPTAFVVYANQHIATNGFDIGTQLRELGSALPIATKQNHTTCQGMVQALFVHCSQLCASNIQYQRSMVGHGMIFSTTT